MADETDDLEYSEANVGSAQAQGVRKNISLKLKGKSRGRGRGKARRTKKTVTPDEDDQDETENTPTEKPSPNKQCVESNLDDVMSKLEAPTFNPMDRTHPEPLHQNNKLRWDHKVNLIGEKVIDPLIHCCEKCSLPILNYGRMIPCKHVFCFDCAKKADKVCPKCEEKVTKVEPSTLGTVFMCNFGGSRHVPGSCGRTYLSQRDLQAHINHRHLKPASMNVISTATTSTVSNPTNTHLSRDPRDPRAHLHVDVTSHQQPIHMQTTPDSSDHTRNLQMGSPLGQPIRPYQTSIPVSNTRPNLITVPIQDDGATPPPAHVHAPPPPAHAPQYAAPPPIPQSYAYHPAQAPPVYSQAPAPLPTQTYSQPPQMHHHPPPPSGPALYSAPPPSVVHHPPPTTYNTAPRPMPQHFPPGGSGYEGEPPGYMVQWTATRGPPPPRPISAPPPQQNPNVRHMPPRGPPDAGYRQPYYQ